MKIYSRGNVLYVEYKLNGKRKRESLNLENTSKNINFAHRNIIPQIERKIKHSLRMDGYKLSEFTDIVMLDTKETKKHNTIAAYNTAVEKFFKIMGDVYVEDVRILDIDRYINTLKKEGLASATISLYLAPIRLAFKEAIRTEVIDKNPVKYAKKPMVKNKKKKPFTLTQMHTLLRESKGELKTFLYIAFYTGARAGEILALEWSDITDSMITIDKTIVQDSIINTPKNGKSRTIRVLKPLRDYLTTISGDGRVFSVVYCTISNKFKNLLNRLGYKETTLHTTRHTFTSLLMQARENPTLIQHFLGHSNLDMINKVYAHYIDDDRDIDRIEKVLNL